jgi:hypothetical protein
MKFDIEIHAALVGVPVLRRDTIEDPVRRQCQCCGAEVYYTRGNLAQSEQMAQSAGRVPVHSCVRCAEPFLNAVAAGQGMMAGSLVSIEDNFPDILERRKRFLESSN